MKDSWETAVDREKERNQRKRERKRKKPQISRSTARASALLMNPLIALIVLINDFSNKPAGLRALINITFFRKLFLREWLVPTTLFNVIISTNYIGIFVHLNLVLFF